MAQKTYQSLSSKLKSISEQRESAGVLLSSALRTANTTSDVQTNYKDASGVQVVLNVSQASGTGGLTILLTGIDPISGNAYDVLAYNTAILAVGTYAFELVPGIGTATTGTTNSVKQRISASLPRKWKVQVKHADGTNYTYSLAYSYIK